MKFYGTLGEVILDETQDVIEIKPFRKEPQTLRLKKLIEGGFGHGGGDYGIICGLYEILCGKESLKTSLASSLESHFMGIYAEESRINEGKLIEFAQKRKEMGYEN